MEKHIGILLNKVTSPLVWIALETTGPNVDADKILEIACEVSKENLCIPYRGHNIVIHHTRESLDQTGKQNWEHYQANRLVDQVLESTKSLGQAENQVLEFLKLFYDGRKKLQIAGNLIYTDYLFLKKHMPKLAEYIIHVLVDVSSIRALCVCWYPEVEPYKWEQKYRARLRLEESIRELEYYKGRIFKAHDLQ